MAKQSVARMKIRKQCELSIDLKIGSEEAPFSASVVLVEANEKSLTLELVATELDSALPITAWIKMETEDSTHDLKVQAKIASIERDTPGSERAAALLHLLEHDAELWGKFLDALEHEQAQLTRAIKILQNDKK